MLIADSHEFIELYRGDKDLRIGMEMVRLRDDLRFVSFAPDKLSPNDVERFGKEYMTEVGLPELPERMEARLLPSRSIRFARKESGGMLSWMPSYGRELRGLRPDVVFENPFSWLTPRSYQTHRACRAMGVPYVYYDPGDDIPLSWKHRVMATWERRIVHGASAIITYNDAGRSRFERKYGYPSEKIHVIPKPVDVARNRAEVDSTVARAAFGAAEGDLVVGYLGRLAAYKGSSVLLDVARQAQGDPTFKNVRFVFVGGAVSTEEREDDYHLENTHVTGMVPHDDVPAMMAACDVIVFPDVTRPGGFPTAVAEAMAAAKTLVVGVGECTEFMPLVDGQTALLVEPGTPEAVAGALRRLAADRDLSRRLGVAVGEFVAVHMDYPVVASEYMEILDRAVLRDTGACAADCG